MVAEGSSLKPIEQQSKNLPLGAIGIILYLLTAPIVEIYCLTTGSAVLNFGSRGWRGIYIYGIVAPLVGYLLWTGHGRARFSLYVFLTIDAFRAIRIFSPEALVLNIFIIGYMQTTKMKDIYPKINKEKVIIRMKGRREKIKKFADNTIRRITQTEGK